MPGFKSIIFHQNSSKIKLFLQKNAKFSSRKKCKIFRPSNGDY